MSLRLFKYSLYLYPSGRVTSLMPETDEEADQNPRGICDDCFMDIVEMGENYMIKDDIWHSVAHDNELLCIGCLEKRLGGRKLSKEDFMDVPLNDPTVDKYRYRSDRLLDRLQLPTSKAEGTMKYPNLIRSLENIANYLDARRQFKSADAVDVAMRVIAAMNKFAGVYINPPGDKVKFLEENGKEISYIPRLADIAKDSVLVILISNPDPEGTIHAAALVNNDKDFESLSSWMDNREKRYFIVKKDRLRGIVPDDVLQVEYSVTPDPDELEWTEENVGKSTYEYYKNFDSAMAKAKEIFHKDQALQDVITKALSSSEFKEMETVVIKTMEIFESKGKDEAAEYAQAWMKKTYAPYGFRSEIDRSEYNIMSELHGPRDAYKQRHLFMQQLLLKMINLFTKSWDGHMERRVTNEEMKELLENYRAQDHAPTSFALDQMLDEAVMNALLGKVARIETGK